MKLRVTGRNLILALVCGGAALWLISCEEVPSSKTANLSPPNRNAGAGGVPNESLPQPSNREQAPPGAAEIPDSSQTPEIVTAVTPTATLTPAAAPGAGVSNTPNVLPPSDDYYSLVAVEKLIIPVQGIRRDQLQDTFKDSRSGGRVHDAIDIIAPEGSPVLAAADGEIARFFDSEKGGITIYQFSRDKKLIYYYAHLQRRADGLAPGQFVKQGTVLGYVGDTGNSGAGNFHLHFAIWAIDDPKRYWNGTNINPYPLLQR